MAKKEKEQVMEADVLPVETDVNANVETEDNVKMVEPEKEAEQEPAIVIPDEVVKKTAEKMVKVRIISEVTNLYILGERYTFNANTDAMVNTNVAYVLRQSKMAL